VLARLFRRAGVPIDPREAVFCGQVRSPRFDFLKHDVSSAMIIARFAQLLADTADLLEISAGDPFRIRSYRRAAER